MIRPIAFFVGVGFVLVLLFSLVSGIFAYVGEPPEETAEHAFHLDPREVSFTSDGPLGRFDRQQVQRGFQVYKEVCSGCHSLKQVAFRDLEQIGFSKPEVKAIANQWTIETPSIDQATGEANSRKPIPSDKFPSPYANEVAARAANNNALPPDLSLIVKARGEGAPYIHSLLTGYRKPDPELLKRFPESAPGQGLYHNPYFHSLNIAMPPPLVQDGQVTYGDGTQASIEQMSKDVTAFLVWTAEPTLEARHRTGIAVMIFLIIFTVLAYLAYRSIWADKKASWPGDKDTYHA